MTNSKQEEIESDPNLYIQVAGQIISYITSLSNSSGPDNASMDFFDWNPTKLCICKPGQSCPLCDYTQDTSSLLLDQNFRQYYNDLLFPEDVDTHLDLPTPPHMAYDLLNIEPYKEEETTVASTALYLQSCYINNKAKIEAVTMQAFNIGFKANSPTSPLDKQQTYAKQLASDIAEQHPGAHTPRHLSFESLYADLQPICSVMYLIGDITSKRTPLDAVSVGKIASKCTLPGVDAYVRVAIRNLLNVKNS